VLEPIEGAAVGGRHDDLILEVGEIQDRGRRHIRPVRRGQIGVLLQREIRRLFCFGSRARVVDVEHDFSVSGLSSPERSKHTLAGSVSGWMVVNVTGSQTVSSSILRHSRQFVVGFVAHGKPN